MKKIALMFLFVLAACDASSRTNAPLHMADRDTVSEIITNGMALNSAGLGVSYAIAPAPVSQMVNHGGMVLSEGINVVSVYWHTAPIYAGGPAAGTYNTTSSLADNSLMGFFLRNVGGSPWYNITSSYTTMQNVPLKNTVTYAGYWANNTNVPPDGSGVLNATMVTMLQSGFDSGKIVYNPNTVYMIFSAGTVNLGRFTGSSYCAYHTYATMKINGKYQIVLYAAMPYAYSWSFGCSSFFTAPSPNNDKPAEVEINIAAHELTETQTNPINSAWYDGGRQENGDKCAWQYGDTKIAANGGKYNVTLAGKNFLIQQNWVNTTTAGCVIKY